MKEKEQKEPRTDWTSVLKARARRLMALKELQRCPRCGGRRTVPDMATASIRTGTLPPMIDCPDCAPESEEKP